MTSYFLRPFALLFVLLSPLQASELMAPTGPVVLEISGELSITNIGDQAHFDMEMLMALPRKTISTTTIWTDGDQEFTGVELADLIAAVGATGDTIRASAVNDYNVDIPIADAAPGKALVAYLRNGAEMPLRNKGPLWIIYPYDSDPQFQSETIYSRSIWQLYRISVLPKNE